MSRRAAAEQIGRREVGTALDQPGGPGALAVLPQRLVAVEQLVGEEEPDLVGGGVVGEEPGVDSNEADIGVVGMLVRVHAVVGVGREAELDVVVVGVAREAGVPRLAHLVEQLEVLEVDRFRLRRRSPSAEPAGARCRGLRRSRRGRAAVVGGGLDRAVGEHPADEPARVDVGVDQCRLFGGELGAESLDEPEGVGRPQPFPRRQIAGRAARKVGDEQAESVDRILHRRLRPAQTTARAPRCGSPAPTEQHRCRREHGQIGFRRRLVDHRERCRGRGCVRAGVLRYRVVVAAAGARDDDEYEEERSSHGDLRP